MKTVIMAGGRGTRLRSVAADIPKPMVPLGGKPVLEHEIACLREQGFTEILITVSYLGHVIMNYFGDGRKFGVKIRYFQEETPLGNAGALFKVRDWLDGDFLLLNADAVFDVDFRRFTAAHRAHDALATLFTHPNSHPYDSGVVIADEQGCVRQWLTKEDPRPQWYANRVNAGLHVLNPSILDESGVDPDAAGRVDLDRQILKPLCGTGKLFCYDSPEYVRDMGTPERYAAVRRDFAAGRVQARNLTRKQKAVFLDRDGTINRHVGFLRDIDDFELLPGAAEGVRKLNEAGFLTIVVTNQPVIARGELTREGLRRIHDKMETLLGVEGAFLDALYYCPHHPRKGFAGEVAELKIDCDCRKPKPGLLLQAARDYHIDLSASWMVGDGERDVGAGRAAGCRTVLLGQDATAASLTEAADYIIKRSRNT